MRSLFTLIVVAVVVIVLLAMWRSWRARSLRDAGIGGSEAALTGEVLAHFGGGNETAGGLQYVSTTPVGDPLTRIAAPGLRYRGPAEVTVRRDGVTIEVVGDQAVNLTAQQLKGTGSAGRRVGKAVEDGGLALLLWQPENDSRRLESSFRFANGDDQERFGVVIARIAHTDVDQQEGTE